MVKVFGERFERHALAASGCADTGELDLRTGGVRLETFVAQHSDRSGKREPTFKAAPAAGARARRFAIEHQNIDDAVRALADAARTERGRILQCLLDGVFEANQFAHLAFDVVARVAHDAMVAVEGCPARGTIERQPVVTGDYFGNNILDTTKLLC